MDRAERRRRKRVAKQFTVDFEAVLPRDCTCDNCLHKGTCSFLQGFAFDSRNQFCSCHPNNFTPKECYE